MAAKKKAVPKRKPAAKRSKPATSPSQLAQLRSMVGDLRKRIEQEARARKLDTRLIAEAKRARDEIVRQVGTLRDQGRKLADQLRATLSDAKKREKARDEALALVAELRQELSRKTEELRRKSIELRDLARESADRARAIITREAEEPVPPPEQSEPKPPADEGEGGNQI
jgi:chromosome segregation ATPase